MSLRINVSGTWQYLSKAYVKVSNAWQPCVNIHVNANGTWKPLYSYWWYTENWSSCSVNCGGGTQTRQVTCVREHAGESNHGSNWTDIDDTCCIKNGFPKPATSQSCNTQECTLCKFEVTNLRVSTTYEPDCTDTEVAKYAWYRNDDSQGSTRLDSIGGIYWDSINVSANSSYLAGTITTFTINGYKYDRSTYNGLCYSEYKIPPGKYIYTTYKEWYSVCRTAV